jgi:hypothetical protein
MSAFATALTGAQPSNHARLVTTSRGSGVMEALGAIARYLPAEGVGLYIAGRSIFSPIPGVWPAILALVAGLGLNALVVATTYSKAAKAAGNFSKGRLAIQLVSTLLLTTVYVAALVGNPVDLLWTWQYDLLVTGFIALVVAAFLPRIAPGIGLVPRT